MSGHAPDASPGGNVHFVAMGPPRPSPAEVKRILRAVATIILAAFVEDDEVKPSKKASAKKKRKAQAMPKRASKKKPVKKAAVKTKRPTRPSKKKVKR